MRHRNDPGEEPSPFEPWEWETKPGDLSLGSAGIHNERDLLTAKERAALRRELKEREARRIPIGFQLPERET